MRSREDSGGYSSSPPASSRTVARDTDRAARGARRTLALVLLVVVAIGALILVGYLRIDPEPGGVRELSERERRALYERTLETLTSACAPATRPRGLGAFCRRQAAFIRQFPECDAACRAASRAIEPTRMR